MQPQHEGPLPAPRAQSRAPGGEVTGAPASHHQQRPTRLTCRRPTRAEEDTGGKGLRPKTGGVCLPGRASGNFRPRATSGPKSVSPARAAASRRRRWLCLPVRRAARPRALPLGARKDAEPAAGTATRRGRLGRGGPSPGRWVNTGKEPARDSAPLRSV